MKKDIQFHIVITAHINLKERILLYIATEIYNLLLDTKYTLLSSLTISPVYVYARKKKKKEKENYHNIREFPILILTMSDN